MLVFRYLNKLLTIDGKPVVEEDSIFKRGMYFYVFYCLCFVKVYFDGYVGRTGVVRERPGPK